MAPTVPTTEPTEIVAGSTATWTLQSSTYPLSEGWTLSYAIRGKSAPAWQSSWVTDDGTISTIVIPKTATVGLEPGRYEFSRVWTGSGSYSGQRFTEPLAPLTVIPDPETAAPGERQTFAEKNLEQVEAVLTARLAGDVPLRYTIGGRETWTMTLAELRSFRSELRMAVWRERNPGQRYPTTRIRFPVVA